MGPAAGRCGFCEICFILASIATLTQGASLQDENNNYVSNTPVDTYQIGVPQETKPLLDNQDSAIEIQDTKIYKYETTNHKKSAEDKPTTAEGWCVIWYLGAFGSLVCFFLIITCMELFFRMPHCRNNHLDTFIQRIVANDNKSYVPETPPPPYHLFAPPDYYETIEKIADHEKPPKKAMDIFVIPVPTSVYNGSKVQHL